MLLDSNALLSYAVNGQMIGVGAGQQSRVDCVKLAGRKAALWFLRQHPKVQALPFKRSVKKQDRINARVSVLNLVFVPCSAINSRLCLYITHLQHGFYSAYGLPY